MQLFAKKLPIKKRMDETKYEFKEGGLDQERTFNIITNYNVSDLNTCRHTTLCNTQTVVAAINERGYISTLLCVQCIKEAYELVLEKEHEIKYKL